MFQCTSRTSLDHADLHQLFPGTGWAGGHREMKPSTLRQSLGSPLREQGEIPSSILCVRTILWTADCYYLLDPIKERRIVPEKARTTPFTIISTKNTLQKHVIFHYFFGEKGFSTSFALTPFLYLGLLLAWLNIGISLDISCTSAATSYHYLG
jgi:hypothetical protein